MTKSSSAAESLPRKNTFNSRLLFRHSAYEQKQPAGMKPSSPVTPPCSTPVSPLHHASPTAAPTPKPDRTYAHIPPSQPLPDNAYSMDHRYRSPAAFYIYITFTCGAFSRRSYSEQIRIRSQQLSFSHSRSSLVERTLSGRSQQMAALKSTILISQLID